MEEKLVLHKKNNEWFIEPTNIYSPYNVLTNGEGDYFLIKKINLNLKTFQYRIKVENIIRPQTKLTLTCSINDLDCFIENNFYYTKINSISSKDKHLIIDYFKCILSESEFDYYFNLKCDTSSGNDEINNTFGIRKFYNINYPVYYSYQYIENKNAEFKKILLNLARKFYIKPKENMEDYNKIFPSTVHKNKIVGNNHNNDIVFDFDSNSIWSISDNNTKINKGKTNNKNENRALIILKEDELLLIEKNKTKL